MPGKMRWTDIHDIAIALEELHPDADIVNLRFTDLWKWVQALPDFGDDQVAPTRRFWRLQGR
jgi:FeS assembly protein IscX